VLPIVSEVGADRRMYLPLAAFVSFTVVCAYELGRFVITRLCVDRLRRPVAVAAGAVLVAGLAFLLGTGTRARSLDYSSDESIWRDTIRKQPGNARARTALGANLLAAGRYQEAETELLKALTLDFSRAETLSNLGGAELMIGKLEASITHLEKAVALRPEYIDAHRNLAEAYRISRQDARAVAHFRLVLTARPNNTVALNHFALILAVSSDDAVRDGAKALELASRAVSLTSRRDPISLGTLAAALAELERFDAAVAALQEALALSTGNSALTAELSRLRDAYAARQKVRRPSRS
jgi:tetratricopeptide (TPR) repeat protein